MENNWVENYSSVMSGKGCGEGCPILIKALVIYIDQLKTQYEAN